MLSQAPENETSIGKMLVFPWSWLACRGNLEKRKFISYSPMIRSR